MEIAIRMLHEMAQAQLRMEFNIINCMILHLRCHSDEAKQQGRPSYSTYCGHIGKREGEKIREEGLLNLQNPFVVSQQIVT